MKRVLVLLIAVPIALAAVPAAASPLTAKAYVACLEQRRSNDVQSLLRTTDGGTARRAYERLNENGDCVSRVFGASQYDPSETSMSMAMLRGRLAQQVLLSNEEEVQQLAALPLQQKRYLRNWFPATGRNLSVDEMGACMADIDPGGVLSLVETAEGSADEAAAIAALAPNLGKCLSVGTRLEADRQSLRAALADALYQRVKDPTVSQSASQGTSR
jgi:hypothetical protein